ncbi:hypothetical protein [Seonamhaeicola sediminis]|uniref:hypothetical protein n=1 Tax=Seonamhaeicola sediminis TaxID=2528206 RepID=UPI001644156C|nr:hypothetical protein [Seonamhaeicola sediminis]
MLLTITFIISVLVLINFILLKFSVNKTKKSPKATRRPIVIHPNTSFASSKKVLAPTGS